MDTKKGAMITKGILTKICCGFVIRVIFVTRNGKPNSLDEMLT